MGIHHWTGYVGYEATCMKTFVDLTDRYCMGCHTDEDVGGCERCEIRSAIEMCKDYVEDMHIPKLPSKQKGHSLIICTPESLITSEDLQIKKSKLLIRARNRIKKLPLPTPLWGFLIHGSIVKKADNPTSRRYKALKKDIEALDTVQEEIHASWENEDKERKAKKAAKEGRAKKQKATKKKGTRKVKRKRRQKHE